MYIKYRIFQIFYEKSFVFTVFTDKKHYIL